MRLQPFVFLLPIAVALAIPVSNPIIQPRVIESEQAEYRLPDIITPYFYNISIDLLENIFTGADNLFYGNTTILFSVSEQTTTINIHANLTLITVNLRDDWQENITTTAFNSTTSILTITTPFDLVVNRNYTLFIAYHGRVEPTDMNGFYRSSYINQLGVQQYLVTTQFQPDYARNAFPCFDEPQYKAYFAMNITHPSNLLSLFNTAVNRTIALNTSFTQTEFEISPLMSSYLVAFSVSDFTCSGGNPIADNVPHRICSRTSAANMRELANQYSPLLMQALENITGIFYNDTHHKMDQIAIPDFSAGAMENWGLVTYREPYLLFSATESSNVDKQNVISIVAHEFAHMWFGNLLTAKWWNSLFLNEGFASYYEYFAPAALSELQVDQVWEMDKQFVVDQVHNALLADGSNSSRALSAQASSSAEIWSKFDTISYQKGAAIIRMVENFIGSANFKSGTNDYLLSHGNGSVEPWNLWASLQKFVPPGSIPQGITLEQIMDNWVNKSGYPVIMVNASGNDVLITQKRFVYNGSDDTQWYVPISYTTAANPSEFQNSTAKEWLVPGGNYILRIPEVLASNAWIIVNNRQGSFYRVNYDSTLWLRISQVLQTNHQIIDVLNRAQIVDDVFNLAGANQLRYSEAISILSYLTNETEYYPLYRAASNFDTLLRQVGESSTLGRELNMLQLQFLNTVRGTVSFSNLNSSDQIYTLKLRLILGRLCKLEDQTCVSTALTLFNNLKNGQSIDANLKSVVYCNGLRYSNSSTDDWNFLWSRFQTATLATEKATILTALGCTKNTTLLYNYLDHSASSTSGIRPQDISRVWSSVINSNPEGVDVAFDYYANNSDKLRNHFSGSVSLITTIASRFHTEAQINKLLALSNNATLYQSVRDAATGAINVATNNYNWATIMSPQLEEHFTRPVTGRAVKNMGILVILLLCSSTILYV